GSSMRPGPCPVDPAEVGQVRKIEAGRVMRGFGRAAMVVATAVGALAGGGGEAAGAGRPEGLVDGGRFVTTQQGGQSLDCGNSADTVNVYLLASAEESRVCTTEAGSAGSGPAKAVGG